MGRPGDLVKFGKGTESVEFRLPDAAHGTEALLELVDASLGIHELCKSCEEWMGVRSDTDRDQAVFHTVDHFFFLRGFGRATDETLPGCHVNEDDRIVFGMKILFHGNGVPATFPTRREGDVGEKSQTVKLASAANRLLFSKI